ncbi:cysteine peptidase family C39 domain-containing protein [Mucilaginibacter antarcticus]
MPFPCIVHWANSHFIVVYRATNKSVFVADPARADQLFFRRV